MSLILDILQLQASPAPTGGQGSTGILTYLLLWGPIIAIFYFLIIAPQRKRQKKAQEMLNNLKNGDKVVTTGGILGTIVKVNPEEESVKLRVAPSVEIEITRSAVAGLQSEPPPGSRS